MPEEVLRTSSDSTTADGDQGNGMYLVWEVYQRGGSHVYALVVLGSGVFSPNATY